MNRRTWKSLYVFVVAGMFLPAASRAQWNPCTNNSLAPCVATNINVGIGTSNPTSPLTVNGAASLGTLDVSGNASIAKRLTITGDNVNFTAGGFDVFGTWTGNFYNTADGANSGLLQLASLPNRSMINSSHLGTGTTQPLDLSIDNVTKLRIDPAGLVGIGGTPLSKLHVFGVGLYQFGSGGATPPLSTQSLNLWNTANSADLNLFRDDATGANLTNGSLIGSIRWEPRFSSQYNGVSRIDGIYSGDGISRKGDIALFTADGSQMLERMRVDGSGNVGIGTPSPLGILDVASGSQNVYFRSSAGATNGYSRVFVNNEAGRGPTLISYGSGFSGTSDFGMPWADLNALIGYTTNAFVIGTNSAAPVVLATGDAERLRVTSTGAVGIGTTNPSAKLDVNGTIFAAGDISSGGKINAKFQDVAEWVPASEDFAPGTVVVLDRGAHNRVTESRHAYDTAVAGVVSLQPGIVLGEDGPGKALIATTGRVRVRVDASRGPIEAGDLLVTSEKPGLAMRSEPVRLGEIAIHRPGTILGKALEPMKSGEGDILVLLSLQ
jgi:hypothetical protein